MLISLKSAGTDMSFTFAISPGIFLSSENVLVETSVSTLINQPVNQGLVLGPWGIQKGNGWPELPGEQEARSLLCAHT